MAEDALRKESLHDLHVAPEDEERDKANGSEENEIQTLTRDHTRLLNTLETTLDRPSRLADSLQIQQEKLKRAHQVVEDLISSSQTSAYPDDKENNGRIEVGGKEVGEGAGAGGESVKATPRTARSGLLVNLGK